MISLGELIEFAKNTAQNQKDTYKGWSLKNLHLQVKSDYDYLIKFYKGLSKDAQKKRRLVPAAEWFLDNFHIISEQVKEIEYSLPRGHYHSLPILRDGNYKGKPRIYAIAVDIVLLADGKLEEEIISTFLESYQTETPLTIAELWAVPFMLRIALIKKIREAAEKVEESQNYIEKAKIWSERLIKALEESEEALNRIFSDHDKAISSITPAYGEHMLHIMREYGTDTAPIIRWLDKKLAHQGIDADEIIQNEHQEQTSLQILTGNIITSMRFLSSIKWEDLFEKLSLVEHILSNDPAGVYPLMEFASRDYYRNRVELLSKKMGVSELHVAEKAIECAKEASNNPDIEERFKHVGYYLIGNGTKKLDGKSIHLFEDNPAIFYFGAVSLITFGLLSLFFYLLSLSGVRTSAGIIILETIIIFIPIVSLTLFILNWVITHIIPPRHIPKYDFKTGIPDKYRTMVIVPTLLINKKQVRELVEQLEVFYLANNEKNLHFALVGDFKDSVNKEIHGENEILDTAVKGIEELNKKYAQDKQDVFYFFHRTRKWNDSQGSWMGWERKRGAIVEFNRLLRGAEDTSYTTCVGDLSMLPKIKYVITIDADTQLPRDTAKRLIGAMAHPLNKPILNKSGTKVVEGYGLIQPRIKVSVDSANSSIFSLIFSGQAGIDPYTTAVSDIYQDIFQEGIFTGKGIYDVDIFNNVLDDAIPENSVLSHDLLEGAHMRTGLATDIELIDGYPSNYIAYSMRLHRWVRGDWQLVPWICSTVENAKGEKVANPLDIMAKWKIIDNMRRSLYSPTVLLSFILGLIFFPNTFFLWFGFLILVTGTPLILDIIDSILSHRKSHFEIKNSFYQFLLSIIFLPYQSYLMADAVLRTLFRVFCTRKNMLEWVTAADAEKRSKNSLSYFISKMWVSTAFSVLFLFLNPPTLSAAGFFIMFLSILWVSAPWTAYKVSKPYDKKMPSVNKEQIRKLRLLARNTWRYFEAFVGSKDNWLPPDNYQEEPYTGAAHRTSPTNIGLYLVSVLAARDLGYIGALECIERLEKTISTMEKLDRWNGHFYNWYNTVTLAPLKPMYISSVDSGNLAVYLITLKQGILDLLERPLVSTESVLGLKDMLESEDLEIPEELNVLIDKSENISLLRWKALLEQLKGRSREIDSFIATFEKEINELTPWINILSGTNSQNAEIARIITDNIDTSVPVSSLEDHYEQVMDTIQEAKSNLLDSVLWFEQLESSIIKSADAASKLIQRCKTLIKQIEKMVYDMDFKVLYDEKKELFSIGYNRGEEQLTNSYYDLFASEARHTSFIAIAKGDIPQKHWFKLGRPLTMVGNMRSLVSWSGTMFEYLMPLLVMKVHYNTLLSETYTSVIKAQKLYGETRSIPWGMSESGYYAFDLNKSYHYKAFGIPQLGLKRSLGDDLVIAPYASIMALCIDPVESVKNIEMLIKEGLYGYYGFYEAIDYTPNRVPQKGKGMIVKSYMAHHHGMSLIALNNYLNNNIMQDRFHKEPIVKATELLLQERIPSKEIFIKEYEEKKKIVQREEKQLKVIDGRRRYTTPYTLIPEVQLLSNGTYSVLLTNSGSSFSFSKGIAVNRWRGDTIIDNYGMYIYIHNLNSNHYWSAAYNPCRTLPEQYEVIFEPHRVIFSRKDGNIKTRTEVVVSPEYNGEIRSVTLTNQSKMERVIEVTSYFETVLTPLIEDIAHPAFNKLFLETEFLPEYDAILVSRRRKNKKENPVWLVHTLYLDGQGVGNIQYETDRAQFIGRGRDLSCPRAMEPKHLLSNTAGSNPDPIISLRKRVSIAPGQKSRIYFLTALVGSKEEALVLAKKFQSGIALDRAVEMAWTHNQIELDFLNINSEQANLYQRMASHIIFQSPTRIHLVDSIKNLNKGQSGLWAYSISGDNPIVVIRINTLKHIKLAEQMLKAHEYWKSKGLSVDLVFLNEYGNSYEQPINDRIRDLISVSHLREFEGSPGGVFLIQNETLTSDDRNLLFAAARLVLSGELGTIQSQLKEPVRKLPIPSALTPAKAKEPISEQLISKNNELKYFNGLGGFSPCGKEYVIQLCKDEYTPMPWSNIVSNPFFGFLVTESGSSCTWYGNSRENKLTPWSNDPLIDPSGEVVFIRDEDTGEFWTITPAPVRENSLYTIRHGRGYSIFEHKASRSIDQKQLMFVPITDPVKIYRISLKNNSDSIKRMSAVFYVEWVLGVNRHHTTPFIFTERDDETGALLAKNGYNEEFQGHTAFMYVNSSDYTVTCDRNEFIGRRGSIKNPSALKKQNLSGQLGAGFDPCGAIMTKFELQPGEKKEIIFLLGQGRNIEEIRSLIEHYKNAETVERALNDVKDYWSKILDMIQVKTPDPSLDLMMNNWLLYQSLVCRVWARTAFYQSSGAFGFRDQLQDMLAIVYSSPETVREHIILCAGHQFLEGDVQHWWHPPFRGVRTKISDDLLFLPYVTAGYIEITGDTSILDETVHFIEDEPLKQGESERYNIPNISDQKADIYEHCILAIDKASSFGEHGLPLIGSGDWNDGMSSVGDKGRGESIWLAWFLYTVLVRFIPICKIRGDIERAEKYEEMALHLVENIENNGWDGGWYRRAYYDDGTPLGSATSEECKIDSISQSWSVISGAGRAARVKEAMRALEHNLIDRETGVIKLLTPPFDKDAQEPGYIKGYIPGVRENGAQYTHAAAWVIMAFAGLGDGDKALELYHMINPINHTRTDKELMKYKVEPYIISADVYTNPKFMGRGGWTWYTGSASWMYRVVLESILGFKKRGDKFTIDPCISKTWNGYSISYKYKDTIYKIQIKNPQGVNRGVKALYLDGEEIHDKYVSITNDKKEHEVIVILGP